MRSLLFLVAFGLASCATNSSVMTVPANQFVELDYPQYEVSRAALKNKTNRALDVAVVSKSDNTQIRGFGLAPKASAEIKVERENRLVIQNNADVDGKIAIRVEGEIPTSVTNSNSYISFTLQNTTAKSIPLLIPDVMNPNLSPFSKSGVDLKIGQEILFRENGRKYVLFTVDNTIKNGEVINVAALLKERKAALGL